MSFIAGCLDGTIDATDICDGWQDCANSEDETNCGLLKNQFGSHG